MMPPSIQKSIRKKYSIARWTIVKVPTWCFQSTNSSELGKGGYSIRKGFFKNEFQIWGDLHEERGIECMVVVVSMWMEKRAKKDHAKIAP